MGKELILKQMLEIGVDKLESYLADITLRKVCICFVCVYIIMAIIRKWQKKDGIHQMSNKYMIVCTFYFTCIAVITILGRTDGTVTNSWDKVFLTYESIIEGKRWVWWEVIFNIILFLPAGMLVANQFKVDVAFKSVFFISFLIEVIQLLTGVGLFEICDLIDNTLGGLVGIILYQLGERLLRIFSSYRKDERKI